MQISCKVKVIFKLLKYNKYILKYKHNLHIVHSMMQRPSEKVRELLISVVIIFEL